MWSACHKKSYLTNLEVRNLKSAVSALCGCLSFACFEKKMGKGFVNIPKFVNSTHNKYLFLRHADHISLVNLVTLTNNSKQQKSAQYIFVRDQHYVIPLLLDLFFLTPLNVTTSNFILDTSNR